MTRPISKAWIVYCNEVNGDWLRKTLCVEHQNTQDCNLNTRDWKIFQNERAKIAISCVLVSTRSDLSVFVSHLRPAKKEPEKILTRFLEQFLKVSRLCPR